MGEVPLYSRPNGTITLSAVDLKARGGLVRNDVVTTRQSLGRGELSWDVTCDVVELLGWYGNCPKRTFVPVPFRRTPRLTLWRGTVRVTRASGVFQAGRRCRKLDGD